MQRAVLFLTAGIAVLGACGPVKQDAYYADPRASGAAQTAAIAPALQDTEHYYGAVGAGVSPYHPPSAQPMFAASHNAGHAAKPAFAPPPTRPKPSQRLSRSFDNTVERWGQKWPVGYTGPREGVATEEPDEALRSTMGSGGNGDGMNSGRVNRMLSSISGDRYVPPLSASYIERQDLNRMVDPADYNVNVMQSNGEGVYVSGEVAEQAFFDHGSDRIRPHDARELRRFAQDIGGADDRYKVSVVGHASKRVDGVTDPAKKQEVNYKMAKKRASAVSDELKRSGVESGSIVAVSKGDKEPNPFPGSKTQEEADRRVDIYLDDLYYYY